MKAFIVLVWTLYLLKADGSLGTAVATFKDKDSCVLASYRASFLGGIETRCGQHGI